MPKNKGYILLYRDIQDNDLWTSEPFSKAQAFVDLLLMANHEEKTFLLGNEIVKADVGTVITSELKLMDKWKWSKKKLRNYLNLLEEMEMIERRPDRKKTTIFLRNYEKYQKGFSKVSQEENGKKETTKDTTKDTTKETALNPLFVRGCNEEETTKETTKDTTKDTTKRPRRDHEETTKDTQTNHYEYTINTLEDTRKRNVSGLQKLGKYKNVLLSDEELEALKKVYPANIVEKKTEALSSYMVTTGKEYTSHYQTLINWIEKDRQKWEAPEETTANKASPEQLQALEDFYLNGGGSAT